MFEVQSKINAEATARVQALIDITSSLNAIFEQENTAIKAGRLDEIGTLQADKARLAASYALSIRTVATDRVALGAVDDGLLMQLRALTECFEDRASCQRQLLDEVTDASESADLAASSDEEAPAPKAVAKI